MNQSQDVVAVSQSKRKKNISLKVPPELNERIRGKASKERDSITRICTKAIHEFVREHRKKPSTAPLIVLASPVGDDLDRLQFSVPGELGDYIAELADRTSHTERAFYFTILYNAFK